MVGLDMDIGDRKGKRDRRSRKGRKDRRGRGSKPIRRKSTRQEEQWTDNLFTLLSVWLSFCRWWMVATHWVRWRWVRCSTL